jgi:DNA-binding transcriptional ArsR family regulator
VPQVTLPADALEALASDSRIRILKALVPHQLTLAQLAAILERDKAVVHRHLGKLLDGGFVEKDAAHAFTYYRLTGRGRGVAAPGENTRIAILLGSAAATGGVAAGLLALSGGLAGVAYSTSQGEVHFGGSPVPAVALAGVALALALFARLRLRPARLASST